MSKQAKIKIVAITSAEHEYTYTRYSAHKVSNANAQLICEELNKNKFRICAEGMKWHVYEIDSTNPVYRIAQEQSFTIRNGYMYEESAYYNY